MFSIAIVMDENVFKKLYTENIKKALEGNTQINILYSKDKAYQWIKE